MKMVPIIPQGMALLGSVVLLKNNVLLEWALRLQKLEPGPMWLSPFLLSEDPDPDPVSA